MKISSFLKERESRIKPDEARKMNLKRIVRITQNGEIFISDKNSNTDMILVKPGDLVISGIGIAKGGGNSLNIYEGKEDVLTTIHYSSYIINENIVLKEFLKILLISSYFRKLLQENSPNGIKAEIKAKHILPIEINIPSIEIQKQIINKINGVKNEIEEVEEIQDMNKNNLKKLRQQILQEAVQGKLVSQDPKDEPASELLKKIKAGKEKLIKEGKIKKQKPLLPISKDEIPYELPKGWEWERLQKICNSLSAGGDKPSDFVKEKTKEKSIPVIANGETNKGIIGYTKEAKIFEKSITVSGRGTIGYSCIRDFSYNPIVRLIVLIPNKNIDIKFLQYAISARLETGLGTSIPQLTVPMISPRLIPIPPLQEQKRIVEKVDKLMTYCDELEKQVKENKINSEKLMEAVLKESFR